MPLVECKHKDEHLLWTLTFCAGTSESFIFPELSVTVLLKLLWESFQNSNMKDFLVLFYSNKARNW